jgi:hypothetical protein
LLEVPKKHCKYKARKGILFDVLPSMKHNDTQHRIS